jgi:hypothetical protein
LDCQQHSSDWTADINSKDYDKKACGIGKGKTCRKRKRNKIQGWKKENKIDLNLSTNTFIER